MSAKLSKTQYYAKLAALLQKLGQAKQDEIDARAELERMLSRACVAAIESVENREICNTCGLDVAEEYMGDRGACSDCQRSKSRALRPE